MVYVLSESMLADPVKAFKEYYEYLKKVKEIFPASAYGLARSEWYYNFSDEKCPHDAKLKEITISEPMENDFGKTMTVAIDIKLAGAYNTGVIEYYYPKVYSYQLISVKLNSGHSDWRYDEFRLSKFNKVIHEIEWSHLKDSAKWIIESDDVIFKWKPK